MGKPLRVLIVEDSEDDTELLLRELRRGGYDVAFERVDTSEAMTAALDGQSWDIAIVDYNLPQFSGLDALALFQEKRLDLPFIIISGTVGEDTAVEAVKAGATDYVMKDRLVRFVPAVERSLREAEERRQRRRTEVELKQSTEQLSLLFGSMPIIPYMAGAGKGDASITYIAGTVTDITGYKPENFTSDKAFWVDRVHPKDAPRVFEDFRKFSEKEYQEHEYRWRVADGTYRWFNDLFRLVKLPDGTTKVIGVLHDVTERKQAEEGIKLHARQQAIIADLGQRALAGSDPSLLMDEVVARVAKDLNVEYCKILELLPDGKALLLRAGVGWKEGLVGTATVGTERESQAGYTLLSSEPVIVEDLRKERRFNGPPFLHIHGVVSGMSVIIHGKDRPFGVLGAHTTTQRTFTKDDINFLQAAANILATAVERKRAEEELKVLNESLEQRVVEQTAQLAESEELFRNMSAAAQDAIITADSEECISYWNEAAERMFGYSKEEVIGKNVHELIAPKRYRERHSEVYKEFQGTGPGPAVGKTLELGAIRKDGTEFPIELSLSGTKIKGKWNAIGIIRDITGRKQAEDTIRHMAYHDVLTRLPNRMLFVDHLTLELAHARRDKRLLAVMFLDLDEFKVVNDTLGHTMGDRLLKDIGDRLVNCVRESDTVARMGGDEFTLLLPRISHVENVVNIAGKVLGEVKQPVILDGNRLNITTSIGVALCPTDGEDAETLLKNADAAMYKAKERGRNNFQFFSPS